MDIDAGMTATQSADVDLQRFPCRRERFGAPGSLDNDVSATGTAKAEIAPCFTVQIQQDFSGKDVLFQFVGAAHTFFLVNGKEGFKRAVDKRFVFEGGQYQRNADTVVRTKGRVFGENEVVTYDGLYRVF